MSFDVEIKVDARYGVHLVPMPPQPQTSSSTVAHLAGTQANLLE